MGSVTFRRFEEGTRSILSLGAHEEEPRKLGKRSSNAVGRGRAGRTQRRQKSCPKIGGQVPRNRSRTGIGATPNIGQHKGYAQTRTQIQGVAIRERRGQEEPYSPSRLC